MVLPMPTWGIREVLALVLIGVWAVVTILLAWRSNVIVEGLAWWAGGPAGVAAIWKIFTPGPPSSGGEG